MIKKITLLTAIILVMVQLPFAQNTWSLQKCIEHAKENSISIKQAQLGVMQSAINEKASRMARYPNLNASVNGGLQFGYTIDPTTNTFDNQRIGFNNWQLNSGITVYAGNRINNTIKQSKVDVKAAEMDGDDAANNLYLAVASAYLNILMAEETYQNTLTRKTLSENQLERIDRLIKAGSLPRNDRLNVLSQMALDDQAIIQAKNAVDIGYLNLKNLIQADPKDAFEIEKPMIEIPADANPDLFQFETVYAAALNTQPNVQAAALREESADIQVDIAKSAKLPSVTAFGGMDSRWSSVAKDFNNPTAFETVSTVIEGDIGGTPISFTSDQEVPTEFPDVSYFDQLRENLGQSLGVTVQVPIYNNYNNRANIERAKLSVLNARYTAEQTRQQLKTDVQTAIANAKATRKTYEAAQLAMKAADAAFANADKRYQLGTINSFDYATARTNLDAARIEVIRSKYDYIFRLKIVDFYTGKELSF